MKIVWISNISINEPNLKDSGGWIISMATALNERNIEIINFRPKAIKKIICASTSKNCFQEFNIPLYSDSNIMIETELQSLISSLSPTIIHIWGTENGWANYFNSAKLSIPILIEMQGILKTCVDSWYGFLNLYERARCIGLKELILPNRSLFFQKINFIKRAKIEQTILEKSVNISVQSEWVKNYITTINTRCTLFRSGIILRDSFYHSKKWNPIDGRRNLSILAVGSASVPYKGAHVLIKAFATLKKQFPDLSLRLIGTYKKGIQKSGYVRFLESLARNLGVQDSINWLSSMDADHLINEIHNASVLVVPSFVESYSLVLAEGSMIGIPCVAAYSGAMPELDKDDSILYFPKGDAVQCAGQLKKVLLSESLSLELSQKSRAHAFVRNDKDYIVYNQINIYKQLIK